MNYQTREFDHQRNGQHRRSLNPLEPQPVPVTQWVLEAIGWGGVLAVPFLIWCAL